MKVSLKSMFVMLVVLMAASALGWGNHLVFNRLLDIRHQNAPMPNLTPTSLVKSQPSDLPIVRIGVVSRFAPNIIYRLYQPIMDYLNAHSDRHHELTLSQSYQDAAQRLLQGEVQASFLGAWMCSNLPLDSGLVPVAMPVNASGESDFHVVLVVPKDSPIHSISDLAGRRVAVPSNQAYSGNWLQNSGLNSVDLQVADLDTIQHFQHHETVIWQVLRGNFAAGVVKESLAARNRDRGLRTVAVSPAIPGPPLVIQGPNPTEAVQDLVQLLLVLDRNNIQDQAMMKNWTPEFAHGFVPADPETFRDAFFNNSNEKQIEGNGP